jgi:hypothetical protein
MLDLESAIKHCEEVADVCEDNASKYDLTDDFESYMASKDEECAKDHRQLAEWLRELKESRKIIDFFLQTFDDFDLDMCCEDLMSDDKEQFICEENCNNKTKACWLRWAKLKVREVNADEDSR